MLKKMPFIMLNSIEELTEEVILKLINMHKGTDIIRNRKLLDYYLGKHEILKRRFSDPTKPNHKVVANFPKYITNVINGYFLGTPVNYTSKNPEALMYLNTINLANDEQAQNSILATNMSIYGVAYQLLFTDEQSEIKMTVLDNNEVIPIYSTSVIPEPIAFIRHYTVTSYIDGVEDTHYVEVYTDKTITYYRNISGHLVMDNQVVHYFKKPPIVVYENGDYEQGDYEDVISLIDCYNLSLSDMANDYAYMADSFLVLKGVEETDPEVFKDMKAQRLMIMPAEGSAEWLTKQTDSSTVEAYRERLVEDICRFSSVPDLSNNEFGSNVSGISLQFKFQSLEQLCANKERMFKKAIDKRNELIFAILNVKGIAHDYSVIESVFKRNMPINQAEIVQMVQNLWGVLSKESLLAQLPFVDDVSAELERIEEEANPDPYATNSPFAEPVEDNPLE